MREGLIPTILGTVVSVAGASFSKSNMKKKNMFPMIEAGIVGFGLAHIVLGAIDLVEHRK
ncbi:asparagine synthase [Clostridium estertheticum]|uniref:Asparagine synthase n=1 Tax=Clostridium estertheticum TaxID=238834 RepID=A0AA47I3X3_9CLOT|nr:asparagine synthase [Clostridium estertheticum]MBU3156158.1 asparagine synthase [Clostridium estertheticum]MBU3199389.1 asparagine synthase [Clostridium estertheticum]WAG58597.1 asparagine synthase [Clostridium estertheticum]WAG67367.1 asparagine synthase [Clostridium estertheticum]